MSRITNGAAHAAELRAMAATAKRVGQDDDADALEHEAFRLECAAYTLDPS